MTNRQEVEIEKLKGKLDLARYALTSIKDLASTSSSLIGVHIIFKGIVAIADKGLMEAEPT